MEIIWTEAIRFSSDDEAVSVAINQSSHPHPRYSMQVHFTRVDRLGERSWGRKFTVLVVGARQRGEGIIHLEQRMDDVVYQLMKKAEDWVEAQWVAQAEERLTRE